MKLVHGFSKYTRDEKINWLGEKILKEYFLIDTVSSFWMDANEDQKIFEGLSENTVSNFHLPFGISPNLVINKKSYCLPMVTEESSVVAAMAMTSKFWAGRGGVSAKVISLEKSGHIHFLFHGEVEILKGFWKTIKPILMSELIPLDKNMKNRGGGIVDISLVDHRKEKEDYFNLKFDFLTCDAMGANYINSILEKSFDIFQREMNLRHVGDQLEMIMAILSNHTPNCLVEVKIGCPVKQLGGENPHQFVKRFKHAVEIANCNIDRAATHNKGIMNGIDSVVIATGNDFRAIEAGFHSYCSRNGKYQGLGLCTIEDDYFEYSLTMPLSIGTVGGVTSLHPLAKLSLDILNRPSSSELMMIIASAGLMQNFAALKALTTTGIQKGHMRMHLQNILQQLDANLKEKKYIEENTKEMILSYDSVREMLYKIRNKNNNIYKTRWGI